MNPSQYYKEDLNAITLLVLSYGDLYILHIVKDHPSLAFL